MDVKFASVFDEAKAILQNSKPLEFLRHPSVLMIKDSMVENESDLVSTSKVMDTFSFFDCYDALRYENEDLQSTKLYQNLCHDLCIRSVHYCTKKNLKFEYPSKHFEQHRMIKKNKLLLDQTKQYYRGICPGSAPSRCSMLDEEVSSVHRVSILDYLSKELQENSLVSERVVSKIGYGLKNDLKDFLYQSSFQDVVFINIMWFKQKFDQFFNRIQFVHECGKF